MTSEQVSWIVHAATSMLASMLLSSAAQTITNHHKHSLPLEGSESCTSDSNASWLSGPVPHSQIAVTYLVILSSLTHLPGNLNVQQPWAAAVRRAAGTPSSKTSPLPISQSLLTKSKCVFKLYF